MVSWRKYFYQGWMPIRYIAALAHLHGGAAKWCTVFSTRKVSLILIRRDESLPHIPESERITLREVLDQIDGPKV